MYCIVIICFILALYDRSRVRHISIAAGAPHSKSTTYFSIHTLRHKILRHSFTTLPLWNNLATLKCRPLVFIVHARRIIICFSLFMTSRGLLLLKSIWKEIYFSSFVTATDVRQSLKPFFLVLFFFSSFLFHRRSLDRHGNEKLYHNREQELCSLFFSFLLDTLFTHTKK